MIVHIEDFTLARAELFHHYADELFRHVHGQLLNRLHELAIHPLGDDLRLAHHEFEAFAAHHLDQDGQLQLATANDLHLLGTVGWLDAN